MTSRTRVLTSTHKFPMFPRSKRSSRQRVGVGRLESPHTDRRGNGSASQPLIESASSWCLPSACPCDCVVPHLKLPGRRWLHKTPRSSPAIGFSSFPGYSYLTITPAVSPCSRDISPTMSYYQGRYDDRSPHSGPYQGRQGQYSQQPAHQGPPQIICE